MAFGSQAAGGDSPVDSGHSAFWFDPSRDGEGWVLEILADDRALLYWFTYDEEGNQRWLHAVGQIDDGGEGSTIEFSELYVTRGAQFGPGFDPNDVISEVVGSATLSVEDCDSGTFFYTAFGQSQVFQIQRLTRTMGAGCQPVNGVPGEPIKPYAGQSGSWFDTAHNGEGFAFQWLSRDEAIVTWYTYDTEGNQYWILGVGQLQGDQIVFQELHSTRGARFGVDFDPDDVEHFSWGALAMQLGCTSGSAQYDSAIAEFGAGTFDLTRLTQLRRPDCPYVAPKLQELYEISWTEIPIETDTNIRAQSIANDGTIAAVLLSNDANGSTLENLALWRPLLSEWEVVSRQIMQAPVMISGDGGTVAGSDEVKDLGEPIFPLRWTEDTDWQPLSNRIFDRSWITALASHDYSHFAGRGHDFGDAKRYPWIWNMSLGQRELRTSDEHPSPTPLHASNDGHIVVGRGLQPMGGTSLPPKLFAVKWTGNQEPQTIRDSLGASLAFASRCNHDCSIIFGFGQTEFDSEHPHVGEAWLTVGSGDVQYLGRLADTDGFQDISYSIAATTPDGSMASGSYDAQDTDSRAFIWTQRTGLISVRTLVEELEIGDDDWRTMSAESISPDGHLILLSGSAPSSDGAPIQRRAVVLLLHPLEGLE